MAKQKGNQIFEEEQSELSRNLEGDVSKEIEIEKIIENPKIESKMGLEVRNPKSKLNLTTKNGMKKLWTLEEALLPQNFRQLSEKIQKGLTEGISASQILQKQDAEKNK